MDATCNTERHINYGYSSRMSKNSMRWNKIRADTLAYLRA